LSLGFVLSWSFRPKSEDGHPFVKTTILLFSASMLPLFLDKRDKTMRFSRKILLGILMVALFGSCKTTSTSDYSGRNRDLSLIDAIKSDAEVYISDRSVLWVEKGYLQKEETLSLQKKIDKSIVDIERFIGIKSD